MRDLPALLALPLLALATAASIAGEPAFSTSFERDDPAPAQRGDDGARVRLGTGPEAPYAARAGMGYSGLAALRFEGTGGRARLFEVDIPVRADTRLSWMVLPEIVGEDTVASTGVSLDLVFDDGRRLSETGARDHHGAQGFERRLHFLEIFANVAAAARAFVRLAPLRRVREHEFVAAFDRFDAVVEIRARVHFVRHGSTCQRLGS